MALRVLDRAKLPHLGDVVFAFVGDQESGEPDIGVSAGMKAFAAAIEAGEVPRPHLAIYVEPTEIQIYAAQIGFFIAEITLTGRSAYFGTPELGVGSLTAFLHLSVRFDCGLHGRPRPRVDERGSSFAGYLDPVVISNVWSLQR